MAKVNGEILTHRDLSLTEYLDMMKNGARNAVCRSDAVANGIAPALASQAQAVKVDPAIREYAQKAEAALQDFCGFAPRFHLASYPSQPVGIYMMEIHQELPRRLVTSDETLESVRLLTIGEQIDFYERAIIQHFNGSVE